MLWRGVVVAAFVAAATLIASAQVAPGDSGKMSWEFFLIAQAGQRTKAAGGQIGKATALLTTEQEATASDLDALSQRGYTVMGSFGRYVWVEAPADRYVDPVQGVEQISFVTNVMAPPSLITNDSATRTDGSEAIGAGKAWNLGYRGQGKKIAIIDGGFDLANPTLAARGYTAHFVRPVATGPRAYEVLEGQVAMRSAHGTSCAIIAGDVAPDAQLFLLSFPANSGPIGLLCAVAYAVERLHVDVISISIESSFPSCHSDGTGAVNDEITKMLTSSTTMLIMAAGNWALGGGADRWSYGGVFTDSDGDLAHDFTQRAGDRWDRNTLSFSAQAGTYVQVLLEWDDWGAASKTTDLDLFLYDSEYRVVLARSTARQFGRSLNPVEGLGGLLPYSGEYRLVIENAAARWYGGAREGVSFQLYVACQDGRFENVEHYSECGTVREVASNPSVVAVGAVAPGSTEVRGYSSRGPTGSGVPKPELFAPDGVTGTVYEHFAGTSASAPYVAGAIVLLLSAEPELTPAAAVRILQDTAWRSVDICGNPIFSIDVAGALAHLGSAP
jgi:subtilisin family serine protease